MAQGNGFYAYTHSRPDGSVFYVGKGKGRRAWNFTHGRNPYHRRVVEKYGRENIVVTVYPCADEAAAFELEKRLIAEHPRLTNMTEGGEGGSPEILANLWKTNPAMRENVAKMTEARRGVKRPAHVVAALVKAHKGKKQTGERLAQTRASQQAAQEAAKAWHSSDEGRKWHEEHGRKSWENREWVECKCTECGRAFASPYPTRAKYCDSRCACRANRRKQGKPVGVRSQRVAPSVLSGKRVAGE